MYVCVYNIHTHTHKHILKYSRTSQEIATTVLYYRKSANITSEVIT